MPAPIHNVRVVGPSLTTLLGLLFVTLKLTGHITWPWAWVLAPFWIGLAIFGALFVLGLALLIGAILVAAIAEGLTKRKRRPA